MSVRKRVWTTGGKERSAWQVDYKDNKGVRRSKTFALKRDAEAWAANAAHEVSRGVHTADSQSITVDKAIEEWLAARKGEGVESSTYNSYEAIARNHISPFLGKERLNRLTKPMIEQFKKDLIAGRTRPQAIRALNHLSMIITEAERSGHVAQNVARGVKVTKNSRDAVELEIPSPDEVRLLISGAGPELRAFVMMAALAGLRASELRGLQWRDIDLVKKTVRVTRRADYLGKLGSPKSAAGRRTIPLAPKLVAELEVWKKRCPGSLLNLVFPSPRGSIWSYKNLTERAYFPLQVELGVSVPKIDRADGLPLWDEEGNEIREAKYGLHALRHAAASLWIHQGIDLIRLKGWMGHAHVQTTIDTYGHLLHDHVADADLILRAERALFPPETPTENDGNENVATRMQHA
jgi:integrase